MKKVYSSAQVVTCVIVVEALKELGTFDEIIQSMLKQLSGNKQISGKMNSDGSVEITKDD